MPTFFLAPIPRSSEFKDCHGVFLLLLSGLCVYLPRPMVSSNGLDNSDGIFVMSPDFLVPRLGIGKIRYPDLHRNLRWGRKSGCSPWRPSSLHQPLLHQFATHEFEQLVCPLVQYIQPLVQFAIGLAGRFSLTCMKSARIFRRLTITSAFFSKSSKSRPLSSSRSISCQ